MVAVAAGIIFALNPIAKTNKIMEVKALHEKVMLGFNNDEFSALFGGDIIFSAEKVHVSSIEDADGKPTNFTGRGVKTFLSNDGNIITFLDIPSSKQNPKTVIEENQYVKLENKVDGDKIVSVGDVRYQEAILVSFGAYILDDSGTPDKKTDDVVRINSDDIDPTANVLNPNAGISDLKVTELRTGKTLLPVRDIGVSNNLRYDFSFLILQDKENLNEGYYEFSFDYMVNNAKRYQDTFGFYLLNDSSYTQTKNDTFGYNSKPTLGWTGERSGTFEQIPVDNYIKYNIGSNGVSGETVAYPTITYDYTRYKLNYTHNANNKNTTYNFSLDLSSSPVSRAKLNAAIEASGVSSSISYDLIDYNPEENMNLVTIMLTEPGTYTFNYSYLYKFDHTMDLSGLGFEPGTIKLEIQGMSAYYSKEGVAGAKLQHFDIAANSENNIDLIIPYGYEYNKNQTFDKNLKLGFSYTLVDVNDENIREGTVLNYSKNSLVNMQLKDKSVYEQLMRDKDFNSAVDKAEIKTILKEIEYVQTNQGSIWIEGDDKFTNNSIYYYHPTKDFVKDNNNTPTNYSDDIFVECKTFSNSTSFNSKGYYLVFVEIDLGGTNTFWQVFAFQYTASSVNIELQAVVDNNNTPADDSDDTYEPIANGKFTNKEVQVSWLQPGIFDRKITPYYYSDSSNKSAEDLMKTTKQNLETSEEGEYFTARLGSDITDGNFKKYLIRLECEGDSVVYKTFTIDKQPISGIQPYIVEERNFNNSSYFAFKLDQNGNKIKVNNSITDTYTAIDWSYKNSGAEITAKYSYVPFVSDGSLDLKKINIGSGNGVTTKYKLGSMIEGIELFKPTSEFAVGDSCVIYNQGIYLIQLEDSAGNKCNYVFVIDRTDNYFELHQDKNDSNTVENDEYHEFLSNASVVFGADIKYSIGDYKIFELDVEEEGILNKYIKDAADGTLKTDTTYYQGNTTNSSSLANIFKKTVNGKYYLAVETLRVVAYRDRYIDSSISGKNGIVSYKADGSSYYVRKIYAYGINNQDTNQTKNNTYVQIEINEDNARGYVYYSNNTINDTDILNLDNTNLFTKLTSGSGIEEARATSANHVVFVWNMGSGNFEVSQVSYQYYELVPDIYNNNGLYFYNAVGGVVNIYSNDSFNTLAGNSVGKESDIGYCVFNGVNNTRAGLYVVKRTYASGINLGKDVQEKSYYFIVDRNGIIDVSKDIGNSIHIDLMDGEYSFAKFYSQSSKPPTFTYSKDNISNQPYNIYLTASKLPAVFKVPTGKYFKNKNQTSANYYAGLLNISVYYYDVDNQLDKLQPGVSYAGETIKIFEKQYKRGDNLEYFDVNILDYLESVQENLGLRTRLTANDENGDWLFLPGRYIIRISDNVENGETRNEKYIGFAITNEHLSPEVKFYSGYSESGNKDDAVMSEIPVISNKSTVSQEYLNFVIPTYIKDNAVAQVDPTYLIVKKFDHENPDGVFYINHEYSVGSDGVPLTESSKHVTINDDGSISVWLATNLRDEFGNIDYENLNQPLKYQITVRYRLNNIDKSGSAVFEKCYQYFENGEMHSYFESTFEIEIDREPPKANIEHLSSQDGLEKDYLDSFGIDSMFEVKVNGTISSLLYFNRQYAKYYSDGKNASDIYAYQVKEDTIFKLEDIASVYYNPIEDISNISLNLPFVNNDDVYHKVNLSEINQKDSNGNTTFGSLNLGGSGYYEYYEIIEQDLSGNTTQYVIHYNPTETASVNLPVEVTHTTADKENSSFNLTNKNLLLTEIKATPGANSNRKFFKVEIYRDKEVEPIKTILSNFTTNLDQMVKDVVKEIAGDEANKKYGSYRVQISTRRFPTEEDKSNTLSSTTNIYLYSSNSMQIDIAKLVANDNSKIILNKAVQTVKVDENNVTIFATEIDVNGVKYHFDVDNNGNIIYIDAGGQIVSEVSCEPNTTYLIKVTDLSGETRTHRFNTSGTEFVILDFEEFGGDGGNNYYLLPGENVYYGFTDATLKYDKTIYTPEVYIRQGGFFVPYGNITATYDGQYEVLTFNANKDKFGGLVEYKVELMFEGKLETHYHIAIDTRLSVVSLQDYSTGLPKNELINDDYYNTNLSDRASANQSDSGIMNLQWSQVEENDYFNYEYKLHELLLDGTIRTKDFVSGETSWVIATREDSRGIYKFEIVVLSKDGNVLGNRLYVFEIKEVGDKLYYVQVVETQEIIPEENSYFTLDDLELIYAGRELPSLNEKINYPLYISNKNLEVKQDANITKKPVLSHSGSGYEITVYKLSKDAVFDLYVGIMVVNVDVNRVKNIKVNDQELPAENSPIFIADQEISEITAYIASSSDVFINKNEMFIKVFYNDILVTTEKFDETYEIKGNGDYSFSFVDLAGNIYPVNDQDKFYVDMYREVVVTINGEAPIQNGYYNDTVKLVVFESAKYATGSLSITAERNGEPYNIKGLNSFEFKDYGSYRVTVTAKYPRVENPLKTVLNFNIINKNEARKSMDLSNILTNKILDVTNQNNDRIRTEFLQMMEAKTNSYNVTYEDIMLNADNLKITSGKQMFTITYLVEDSIYPPREMSLSFTLNDADPKIVCSLERGDSTTKNFTITFNAAAIYEQIGEAYIYVNNEIVAHIVEGAENVEQNINFSFKNNGDGDYYVRIVSTSGVVLDSFKVTIKEPLNTGAIIVIIVVVAVVAAVVVAIVMLRRRMRIR